MLTPKDIRTKTERLWKNGAMLRAVVQGEDFFPLRLAWGKPTARQLREDLATVRRRIMELQKWAAADAEGRVIEWQEINHRSLGRQQVPAAVLLNRDGFLRCCGKEQEFTQFMADLAMIRSRWPGLEKWLANHVREMVKYGGTWEQLLAVAEYFRAHPRPNLYIRQLDIAGVDTKFIDRHRRILASLLDEILPPEAVDRRVTGLSRHGFERRFGLRYDEPLIRLRFLDPARAPHPACLDLTLPVSALARLRPGVSRVIITENKINGLTFPDLADALIIFGLGYGIQSLADIPWLPDKSISYWGDIDTHGFSILSLVRSFLPQTRSLLMDRDTLLCHRALWGQEEPSKRCLDTLQHLTEEEKSLYNDLKNDILGERIRLEQERIRFSLIEEAARQLLPG